MLYFVGDANGNAGPNLGGLAYLHTATQHAYWLNDVSQTPSDPYGLRGSAHEFGHAIGLVHPWDLPENVDHDPNFGNVPGDVMGYSNGQLPLDQLFIRRDVKNAMGL